MFEITKKILIKLLFKKIFSELHSKSLRDFKLEEWEKELFLYHGSLGKNEPQYRDPRFVGLPLNLKNIIEKFLVI